MSKDNDDAAKLVHTSNNNVSNAYEAPNRDPYFAFIPQIAQYGASIVSGEVQTVKNGIVGFPKWSKDFSKDTFEYYKQKPRVLFDEIISGFTVAIMQVPESIAFSFVAGVPPLSGLHATFWMAAITGVLGGKPGMISGAAGALAVVVTTLTADDGDLKHLTNKEDRLNVLYMTMFVCGIMQMLFCVFRLAKLVRLIPETGMIAFMDGLAIIIFMAQLPAFQKCDAEDLFVDCEVSQREWLTFQNDTWVLVCTLAHVGICMLIMKFFGKIPKVGKIVPSSLIALLVGTLIEFTLFRVAFGVETRTVGETAEMSGTLPKFDWPTIPNDSKTVTTMLTYAITLATIGSVESVLTLQACNEITDTVPKVSDSNQELFAQGLANAVCGLFRAMGGDAMIGQSTINIMNGARHRVSSTFSGLFMLLFVVAISDFIELLPIATLTGVLFMVVLSTFQWQTFQILRYGRLSDSLVIVLVTLVAVLNNLAVAIGVGVVFSALVHAWDSGACVSADIYRKLMMIEKNGNKEDCDVKYVHVKGSLFFGSARHFIALFSVSDDPPVVVIDFKDALIIDHSAVAAIQGITHRFRKADKEVLITNLAKKCTGRIYRTGDHDVLNSQIPQSQDVVLVTVEEKDDLEGSGSEIEYIAISFNGAQNDDSTPSSTLSAIPMLHSPAEDVDVELEKLSHNGNMRLLFPGSREDLEDQPSSTLQKFMKS